MSTIESIINETFLIEPKTIKDREHGERIIHNYEAYCKEISSTDISGNLDTRGIKSVFSLYGLPNSELSCDSMLKVKNKRNSLAHGNETFSEVGSSFTIDDLFSFKYEITSFLEHLIADVETHIAEKKFIKNA